MTKNVLLTFILILISACSTNNSIFQEPLTSEKKTPGLFSKDSEKGISLTDRNSSLLSNSKRIFPLS